MAKQRTHSNQLAFEFQNVAIPMTPMTAEHAAIVHAHLPPPILPPIIPSAAMRPRPAWNFRESFPVPLPQALAAGLLGDEEPTTEHIEALHLEHANELLGILDCLEALRHAKETGTNPQTGKRPRTAASQERLDEQLEREPAELRQRFEDLLAVYADGFGSDAAEAFGQWVRAVHRNPPIRAACRAGAEYDVPIPAPLQSAIENEVFGVDENEDPIEPSPDEVREISMQHGERLSELFVSLDGVNESLAVTQAVGRHALIQEKERLTCQIHGTLGLYAEDFGEVAARHLESWARHEAHQQGDIKHGPEWTSAVSPSSARQYDPGHPWHYLSRGDGQKPVPVEDITYAEIDDTFTGKLPKERRKRRATLSQMLADQSRQLDEDKARYRDIIERGALALSEYDRNIAYGGDHELAVASSLALKFNHISNGLARVHWLRRQLGVPVDFVPPASSSTFTGKSKSSGAPDDATGPKATRN